MNNFSVVLMGQEKKKNQRHRDEHKQHTLRAVPNR